MNIAIKVSNYRAKPNEPYYIISKDLLKLLQDELGVLTAIKIVDKETYNKVNKSQAAQ